MPDEKKEQPVAQEKMPETSVNTDQQQDVLPDEIKSEVKPEDKVAELQQQYEKEKEALQTKVREAEEAKIVLEKRLKDNQEYISRTRNVEKSQPSVDIPRKTFDEYLEDVAKKFEGKSMECSIPIPT